MATKTAVETCENCDRTIGKLETPHVHDGHVVCADCFGVLADSGRRIAPAVRAMIESASDHACPKCGSEATASLPVIYREGTLETTSTGIGFGGDGEVFVGGGASVSRSAAAQWVAPPEIKKNPGKFPVFLGGSVCVVSLIILPATDLKGTAIGSAILFGVIFIVGLLIWGPSDRSNKMEHSILYKRWAARWMCRRCGTVFEPDGLP